jgi:hypothetical protein
MSSYRPGTSSTNLGSPSFAGLAKVRIQRRAILVAVALLAIFPACAQYPGQVTKTGKDTPELRAIAVLEFTGEPGKPNRSRLVPVAVLDAGQLQDGAIYLARPEPLSLSGEVEYELEQNGKPIGLYDIRNASQEQGSWVGYGTWRPMPVAKSRPSQQQLARTRIDEGDAQSDVPVLHRKHHADDRPSAGSGSAGSGGNSSSGGQSQDTDPVSDPDRPTLHKSASSGSTGDTSSTASTTGASSTQASDTSSDPDKPALHRSPSSDSNGSTSSTADTGSSSQTSSSDSPTLHRRDSSDTTASDSDSGSASASDPDRPVLHKTRKIEQQDSGQSETVEAADPDRPTLKRGKSSGPNLEVVPSLVGTPPDVQQAVAVSDVKTHPVHPWTYSWSSPDDEAKMKSSMEDIARTALGLNSPTPPPAPKRTTATTRKSTKPAPPPPVPAPLVGEQFHVFELAYGSGATMVLSAHTDGPVGKQKFVTLIAQPDLYGNVLVLLKNVTDGAHLDDTPRMRLVDAVDAMADNRGELLFELRGATRRQFALYRVLRGQAEKLFVTGGEDFSAN